MDWRSGYLFPGYVETVRQDALVAAVCRPMARAGNGWVAGVMTGYGRMPMEWVNTCLGWLSRVVAL
jgi:hypothetical protein